MTRQVVLIGNSHLAALLSAHGAEPGLWPELDIHAVGARIADIAALDIDETGTLTGRTAFAREAIARFNTDDRLPLAPDAALVVTGAQLGLPRLLPLFRTCAWLTLPSIRALDDAARMERVLMSRQAVARAAEANLATAAGPGLARRFCRVHRGPVLVVSQPRTSEAVMDRPRSGLGRLKSPVRNGDAASFSRLFEEAATRAVIGAGATYLPQPRHTIKSGVLTQRDYAKGAVKLNAGRSIPQDAGDLIHANAAYGAEVLQQISDCIAA